MMRQQKPTIIRLMKTVFYRLVGITAAVGLTLILFLVLPLMQTLSKPPVTDTIVQSIDTAKLDAPPPPPQEEQKEEPKQEETPPELNDAAPPLDLTQLELALNPGMNDGWTTGDFAVKLNTTVSSDSKGVDDLFSVADLDQKPRIVYQPGPSLNKEARKKTPGTVYIIFVVDQQGRVENPMVQKASDPVFEKPALVAVKQWKFEPGKRNGQPVRFRMRVPITFPKG